VSAHHIAGTVAPIALGAASGTIFGWVYFMLLRHWSAAYIARAPVLGLGASALARMAIAAAFFTLTAHWGAPSLLACFFGFLLARTHAVRRARAAL